MEGFGGCRYLLPVCRGESGSRAVGTLTDWSSFLRLKTSAWLGAEGSGTYGEGEWKRPRANTQQRRRVWKGRGRGRTRGHSGGASAGAPEDGLHQPGPAHVWRNNRVVLFCERHYIVCDWQNDKVPVFLGLTYL